MKYRLPCQNCDASLTVEPKDAGRELPCPECQSMQKLPSMNSIRQLEPVEVTGKQAKTKKWSMLQGSCFGIGLMLVIGSLVGFMVNYPHYKQAAMDYEQLIEDSGGKLPDYLDRAPVERIFNSIPVAKLWTEWIEAQNVQLGRWAPATPYGIVLVMERMQATMIQLAIVGGVGLVCMVVAMFLP